MSNVKAYWFPAKRYGWGWGFPSTWQGWVVLVAYFIGIVFVAIFYPPGTDSRVFYPVVIGLSIVVFAVCWLKGEQPRWRWGDDA